MGFNTILVMNLVFAAVFFDTSSGQQCDDCCNAARHTERNEPRRSTLSVWEAGNPTLCDRSLPWGWYRFTSFGGSKMPTTKIAPNRCGTAAPVWLRGAHPTVAEGTVTRTACINFFNVNNGCFQEFDVSIRNCTTFYVYYLRPTYSCPIAYCAGDKEPCPIGKVGEPPDCSDPPVEFSKDDFGEPSIAFVTDNVSGGSSTDPGVILKCTIPVSRGITSWKNVSYRIDWYSEGKLLGTEQLCGSLPIGETENDRPCPNRELYSLLPAKNYTVNHWISCNVSAKFTTLPINPWSEPKYVLAPFFAGLKVSPSSLDIPECSLRNHSFTITPTIPIRKGRTEAYLNVSINLPKGIMHANGQGCAVTIKNLEPVEVRVVATCTTAKGRRIQKAIIIPEVIDVHSEYWPPFLKLPAVWVSVIDNSANVQYCESFTDPHLISFGWFWGTFMGHGDFILYQNAERYFEIQTRQWLCVNSGSVTCNCGAVLRDHNDVIEFNCCNENLIRDEITPMRLQVRSKERLAPGIYIQQIQSGFYSMYKVLFPSGSEVNIYRNFYGLNIELITPRAKDVFSEKGLCLYNGTEDIDTFGNRFRIEPGESFFDTLPPRINYVTVDYAKPCSCHRKDENGKLLCFKELPVHFPNVLDEKEQGGNNDGRKRRSIQFSDDLTDEDFAFFKSPVGGMISHQRFRRASINEPISKENATRYCEEKVANTEVGKLCAELGTDVKALVDSCSIDLELTGDHSFAIDAATLLMNQCGARAAINMSVYNNDSSEVKPTVVPIVTKVAELLCPNDCTLKGKCVNGSCVCKEDYTSSDCSISIYQIPQITKLQGHGLCDRRQRPCKKVTVMGSSFSNSNETKCHIQEYKVVNSSWEPNSTELLFPGVMTDLILLDCYLPDSPVLKITYDENNNGTPAAGLIISVSNNGVNKSEDKLKFISYDSTCMDCNISYGCFLKNESCFINHYCFAPNASNPGDWCLQCLPDIAKYSWTKRKINLPPQFAENKEYFVVNEENLELPIDVSDPEGMPITVDLIGINPREAVIQDNTLFWNVTTNSTTRFHLKATDACQAFSMINITIDVLVCQCKNNGRCVPHPSRPRGSGFYECSCAPGFTGDDCNIDIDNCQSYPCSRGRCIDMPNNYTCICDPGFVGRSCDHDFDDCASAPCVHGNCADFVSGYSCNCQDGYTGKQCDQDIDECESSPCKQGTCVDQVNSYICQCHDGYTGYNCDQDIDECQSSPCVNGTCIDEVNAFRCICLPGFTGKQCEEDINDCTPSLCGNGTCTDHVNNYSCKCNIGFTGIHCDTIITHCSNNSCYSGVTCNEDNNRISCGPCPPGFSGDGRNCEDINYCLNVTCENGGFCVDGINNYTCSCLVGFTGNRCQTDIDNCLNRTCNNGGSCVDGVNNYTCLCHAGFAGEHCETDIDDCVNRTCGNGTCIDGVNTYSCVCQVGFTGERCQSDIDDCFNRTCNNGGSCVDGVNNYTCICQAGYAGEHCETDVDDCANHTCTNGGSCVDSINSYSCVCQAGFTDNHCQTDIDDCVNHACINGGSCVDHVNSYSCVCQAGFTGDHCETDIDDCSGVRCANGGTCVDSVNDFMCACKEGFTGNLCETDINYCLNVTCENGGFCVDGINNYTCSCQVGFTGDRCQTDIDDCFNRTCNNGGSCVDGVNNYTCLCHAGFAGAHCETDTDDCVSRTCDNGGSCVDGINSYTCVCPAGYTGSHCEMDIIDCIDHACNNGGSCVEGINSFSCVCQAGFSGPLCETDIDDCVNHTCHKEGSCLDGVNSYSCVCQTGFTGVRCETNVDDCRHVNCENGGTCIDGINDFRCTCKEGFTGNLCETDENIGPSTDINDDVTTTTPTSRSATEEKLSKEFTMEIRINEKWNEDLRDKNSDAFKNVSSVLTKEIWKSYSENGELEAVKIMSLSPGSIVAEFQLLFKTAVNQEQALAPLKKEVEDGKLGSLVVEPDSLKQKTNDEDDTPEKSTNLPMIIGISCGAFFLVAIVTVWFVRHRRLKDREQKPRVGSDEMPQEMAVPNPQKYEMKIVKKEENLVWTEERGLWNSGIEQPA